MMKEHGQHSGELATAAGMLRLPGAGTDVKRGDAGTASSVASRPLLARMASAALGRMLGKLQQGCVTLIDGGTSQTHGEAGSDLHATVTVHDHSFYARSLFSGSLGAAEAFMDGLWSCDDLTALCRIFTRNAALADGMDRGIARLFFLFARSLHWLRRNSRVGSRRNIEAHYDLGNDFFALWLDETMTYSSGYFESSTSTLHEASVAKLERICRRLSLSEGDHVLEIGTGWGSFAMHAAANHGCKVTTTTISKEQYELASERIAAAGLSDKVTVLMQDYRDLSGQYDKLVSIEMIEAVGHDFLPVYFGKCAALLKPEGAMLLQVINMNDQRYEQYRRSVDFIQRYVFPGSCCPSTSAVMAAVAKGSDFKLSHQEDFGLHYAKTLRLWRQRFFAVLDEVRAMGYDERFIRMWDYYLSYCEAGFAERYIGVAQMLLTKPRWQPRGEVR